MTNIEGCRANPIDWEMYESMIATQTWTGGWVKRKEILGLVILPQVGMFNVMVRII